MDTPDFQVGDWVRCVHAEGTHGLEDGKVYQVTYTDKDPNLSRRIVKFGRLPSPGFYAYRFVRAIAPMPDTRSYLEFVTECL